MLRPMTLRIVAIAIAIGLAPFVMWTVMLAILATQTLALQSPMIEIFSFLLLYGLLGFLYFPLFAGPVLGVCIIITAPPIWWALHKTGLTHPAFFIFAGTSVASIAGALLEPHTVSGLQLASAITGAVCGFVIWRFGYKKP